MNSRVTERPPRPSGRRCRGFTLLELLVAATIVVFLAGFIAAIVRNVGTVWSRAGTRLGTDAQARIVLDQLQLDLQSALYRDDGNVWLAADVLNGARGGAAGLWQAAPRNGKPVGGPSLDMTATRIELPPAERGRLENARFGTAGVWLRFFTHRRGANSQLGTASAPVAVGYQIVRRFSSANPQNQNTGYLLHRVEVRPAAAGGANARPGVLEAGYDITAAPYRTNTSTTNSGLTGDPRTIQIVAANARNLDSVLADNVIDFGIRAYVRDPAAPGGLRLVFPAANAAGQAGNSAAAQLRGRLPPQTRPDGTTYNQVFPDVVDVMVRILTDDGAAEIARIERIQTPPLAVPQKYNGNAQLWWWGVAQENSRVYTRRIVIHGEPL